MSLNSDSRTVNAGKNAISALINKFCILLLTFIGRKIFIQYIGIEYLGINGLFYNILTLLSMADLGLGTAMNVSLYKPIAENDIRKLSALLNYFRQIYCFIAIAVTVIGFAIIPFLPYIVNVDSEIPHLYLYYVVFVLKNTVSYLFVYKSSIINADQKNYLVNNIGVFVNFFRIIIQIIFVIITKNYLIYIIIDLFSVIIHNVAISKIADKQYPFIIQKYKLSIKERNIIFSDIYSAFLYKVSGSILGGTDNILISIIVGTVAVGLYSNYQTITSNLETVIMLLFTSLTAGIGNLIATSDNEKKYSTYRVMQMVGNWLGSYISICLFFLMEDFIVLWLDKEMLLDSSVLVAVVINMYYTICMRPVWTFREGTGMYRQIRYIMFAAAFINIVLSILFGRIYGIGAILIATSIAKFSTCFWYEPNVLFKKFFAMKPCYYYIDYFKNIFFTLFLGFICYIPMRFINRISFLNWFVKALICTIIVNVLSFFRYHKTQEFKDIKRKLKGLLKFWKRN